MAVDADPANRELMESTTPLIGNQDGNKRMGGRRG